MGHQPPIWSPYGRGVRWTVVHERQPDAFALLSLDAGSSPGAGAHGEVRSCTYGLLSTVPIGAALSLNAARAVGQLFSSTWRAVRR